MEAAINYYSHHIGDYLLDTAHLTFIEDAAYRRLLDRYYAQEAPLVDDIPVLCRIVRAVTPEERQAVETVLSEYFTLTEDGWSHKRCNSEIVAYQAKADANRKNGTKGGRPKAEEPKANPEITQWVPTNNPVVTLTKNQEPITNNQGNTRAETQRATRLPADWEPSLDDSIFCQAERPDLVVGVTASRFRDYWIAQPGAKGKKLDWSATWRNWVRNERQQQQQRPATAYQAKHDQQQALINRISGKANETRQIIDLN